MKGARVITYIALTGAQVVIQNFLDSGPWILLSLLPVMVMALDIRYSPVRVMSLAFLMAFAVDFFATGVPGLTIIPLVALAFAREMIIKLVFGSELFARKEDISERKQGFAKVLTAIFIANLLFFTIFVWIEAAGARNFAFCVARVAGSVLVSTVAGIFAARLINSVEDAGWK